MPDAILKAHLLLPPGWVAYSAVTLKAGNAGPAIGAALAASLMGALGLMRAYRMTLRFYQGVEPELARKRIRKSPKSSGVMLIERRLPGLQDDTAALALATLRGFLRAPELKMAFITPLVFIVVFASFGFSRAGTVGLAGVLAGTAAAVLACFSFAPTMSNTFGLDRDGFRALVLLPTPRHQVLLAKNLAFFPFILGTAVSMLLVAAGVLHLGLASVVAGLLQVPAAFMLFCLLCNWTAILAPYRFSPGTLQAKKPKPIIILANFLVFLAMPIVALPLAVPPGLQMLFSLLGWPGGYTVNLLAAAVSLTAISLFYWYLLPVQGRLLQTRERSILQAVTEEKE